MIQVLNILILSTLLSLNIKSSTGESSPKHDKDFWLDEEFSTGYLGVSTGSMFYYIFKSRDKNPKAPLFIFLQGGPGCSDEGSILAEMGPYRLRQNLMLTKNEYSWINTADGLFIDSPLGVGFSLQEGGKVVANDLQAAQDLYVFLTGFMDKYPEYKGRSLYITGISYAGHYVPKFTQYILDQKNSYINLEGIAVGDGWVNPGVQMRSYPYYSLQQKLINNWQFVLSSLAYEGASFLFRIKWHSAGVTLFKLGEAIIRTQNPTFNKYNINEPNYPDPNASKYAQMSKFFNSPFVQAQLSTKKSSWEACDKAIYEAFESKSGSLYDNFGPIIGDLLNRGVKTVLYAGDLDWICNMRGVEEFINSLEWEGKEGFSQEEYKEWISAGRVTGKFKRFGVLTYALCYDAGHAVAADQPQWAYELFTNMIYSSN